MGEVAPQSSGSCGNPRSNLPKSSSSLIRTPPLPNARRREEQMMPTSPSVVFRFRRPSGSPAPEPSMAMTEALRQLSQAREMEPLLRKAQEAGREVVIDVFQIGRASRGERGQIS